MELFFKIDFFSVVLGLCSCACASHCGGFPCGTQVLGRAGFGVAAQGSPGHWLSICGAQAQLPLGTWGLSRSGTKLVSPALAS